MVCVNSVSVSPGTLNLEVGQYGYPSASVSPSNATCKDVRWSSSNSDVASVNSTSGYVYAKAQGSATITARATDGSGKSDSLTVYVSEPSVVSVTSVTVTPGSMTLYVCDEAYASATVYPSNATNTSVTWNSENTSVARVNSSGKITAIGPGQTKVYATANDGSGKRDYVCVTVEDYIYVESITVDKEEVFLKIGDLYNLSNVTISPQPVTNGALEWSSSNTDVVTIEKYTGLMQAISNGTATITISALDGSGVSCTVSVIVANKIPHGNFIHFSCHGAAVCNDGVGDDYGDIYNQSQTAFLNGILDADIHRYIVVPMSVSGYSGLGRCVGVAIRENGTYAFGVVGDVGPATSEGELSEFSVKMIKELGYDTDGAYYVEPEDNVDTFIFTDIKCDSNITSESLNSIVSSLGSSYYY